MLGTLDQFPVVTTLGWTLIHGSWLTILLFLFYWLIKWLLRNHSARARYGLACVTMFLIVLSMMTTFVLLAYNLFGQGPLSTLLLPSHPIEERLPHHIRFQFDSDPGWISGVVDSISPAIPFIGVAWIATVLWQLVRTGLALNTLHQLTQSSTILPPDTVAGWQRICALLLPGKKVLLGESIFTTSPFTAGWLKPLVLLPVGLLTSLPPHQIEAILAHELAHIRRRDYLVNILQTIAELLLFFHPCVRWLGRDIRNLREHCCDDLAIDATGGSRRRYAEALIAMEEYRPDFTLALGIGGGSLLDRVQRLVHLRNHAEKHGLFRPLLAGAIVLILLGLSADAAILRVQEDRITQAAQSRSVTTSIYEVLDASRDNPEFLPAVVSVLEKFRRSSGLDPADADRLSVAINKGARNTEVFVASQEIYYDNRPSKPLPTWKWKGGPEYRMHELATALYKRASEMPPGSERHKMARAALILGAQQGLLPNNSALSIILRDIHLQEVSGMPAATVHRLRFLMSYHQQQFHKAHVALLRMNETGADVLPPEITPEVLANYPYLAWRINDQASLWPVGDPRRARHEAIASTVPVFGPVLADIAARNAASNYYSSSLSLRVAP